jgi:hypothetical protein
VGGEISPAGTTSSRASGERVEGSVLGWTLLPQRYFTRSSRRRAEFAENCLGVECPAPAHRSSPSTTTKDKILGSAFSRQWRCGLSRSSANSASRGAGGLRRHTAPRTPREPRGAAMPERRAVQIPRLRATRSARDDGEPRSRSVRSARSPFEIRVPPLSSRSPSDRGRSNRTADARDERSTVRDADLPFVTSAPSHE